MIQINKKHLVCVVLFENNEIKELQNTNTNDIEGIYIQTIANQYAIEKKIIIKELRRHGIISLLTSPENLNADVINKYLELKNNQAI